MFDFILDIMASSSGATKVCSLFTKFCSQVVRTSEQPQLEIDLERCHHGCCSYSDCVKC